MQVTEFTLLVHRWVQTIGFTMRNTHWSLQMNSLICEVFYMWWTRFPTSGSNVTVNYNNCNFIGMTRVRFETCQYISWRWNKLQLVINDRFLLGAFFLFDCIRPLSTQQLTLFTLIFSSVDKTDMVKLSLYKSKDSLM